LLPLSGPQAVGHSWVHLAMEEEGREVGDGDENMEHADRDLEALVSASPASVGCSSVEGALSLDSVECAARAPRRASIMAWKDSEIPEPSMQLPPEVFLRFKGFGAEFSLQCAVDLKAIVFGARHSEYNPRRSPHVVLRLVDPYMTVRICQSGKCTVLVAKVTEEQMRSAAKRVTRIVQHCGHPDAKCAGFRIRNLQAFADLRFPVRLETLAEKWRRHVLYEPEVTSWAFFRLQKPKCTIGVSASGKFKISGCIDVEFAQEALKRMYPIFLEFSH